LKNQLATLITPVQTFDGILWDKNIYFSRFILGPAQVLDCMNECVNVQPSVCQMFAFENGICYLGRSDITNGSVVNKPSNATVYSVTSKYITN
jgi:hypothetical protein